MKSEKWMHAWRTAVFLVPLVLGVLFALYGLGGIGNALLQAKFEQGYARGKLDCGVRP